MYRCLRSAHCIRSTDGAARSASSPRPAVGAAAEARAESGGVGASEGGAHPQYAVALNNLAAGLRHVGRGDEARQDVRAADRAVVLMGLKVGAPVKPPPGPPPVNQRMRKLVQPARAG